MYFSTDPDCCHWISTISSHKFYFHDATHTCLQELFPRQQQQQQQQQLHKKEQRSGVCQCRRGEEKQEHSIVVVMCDNERVEETLDKSYGK